MKTKCEEKDGYVVIYLSGRIRGGPDATMFYGHIFEYISANKKNIIVQMTKVEWMATIGIGMFKKAKTWIEKEGGQFKISNVQEKVLHIITISQLVEYFNPYDTLEEAIKSL